MLRRRGLRVVFVLVAAATIALWPAAAGAHYERPTTPPDGTGHLPTYRDSGQHLVVCKNDDAEFARRINGFPAALQDVNRALYAECIQNGYRDLQAAVDHITSPGMTILVLPGVYLEEPSLAREADGCYHLPAQWVANVGYQILSYKQQETCPHQQNLVGIFGAKDLQIEGTGAAPSDVIFDAQFQKLNVIRADRTNGIYLRNFTAQRSTFNAVYVIETDGFVIDHVVGRWDNEYGFLSFAADHGLITNCEAYGNGDSGIYPGGTSDINRGRGFDVPRYAIEVTGCRSHDNALGYSGTGGDSVWVHNNEFDHNSTGASMDSLFPNHPGLPQNHALFEHNLIHGNNSNYYPQVIDGTCARSFQLRGIEKGVVCPSVGVPVGAGVLVIGGNYDVFRENWVYDNWKVGFVQTWVPALVRNDFRPSVQEQTSNFDRYIDNHMGSDLRGDAHPNGLDFFWDGQGTGSCWQTIHSAGTDPLSLPACSTGAPGRILSDPSKLVMFFDCANYDLPTQTLPLGCDWFDTPQRPGVLAVSFTAEAVAPVIQLLAVLLLFSWMVRRRTRLDALDVATAGAAVLAAVLLLVASIEQYWYLAPPGIALLGIAWIAAARLAPTQRLAVLSVLLGVAALMESIDSAILQLPVLIGPVWARLVLEAAWIVWTVVALNTVPPRPIGDAGLGLRSEPSRAGIIATKNSRHQPKKETGVDLLRWTGRS